MFLKRILAVATIPASLYGPAMAFEIFDRMLGIAHAAPWSVEAVETEMRALTSVTPNPEAIERGGIAHGLDDEHYWISGFRLSVQLGASQAQGMFVCSRVGRKGWLVVLEQAEEPFIPFSSSAAGRIDFLGFFSDDPQPFPEGAYLRLECEAVLFPLASMPQDELEDVMETFADRLRENYVNVGTSELVSSGFFAPPLAGVVASGGADFGSYRLDSVEAYMDPGGMLNFSFSAWAMLSSS